MAYRKKVLKLNQGLIWNERKGKAAPEYFEELLDQSAKDSCCGIDCCEGKIILPDQATGDKMMVYIANGALVVAPLGEIPEF